MDIASLGPYCQDLGMIFSQYNPNSWLIRYIYFIKYMFIGIHYSLLLIGMNSASPLWGGGGGENSHVGLKSVFGIS